ncbi:MAG: hypothetical protein HY000_38375 [Planctomycetes bacterium]|nr:hypothetical protein [Planctomycetota bacterium]
MPWVRDPHSGGVKISKPLQERIRKRILAHAEKQYKGRYLRLDVRAVARRPARRPSIVLA